MLKLCDVDGLNDVNFGLLVKFSKKRHLEHLRSGSVYMNTFRYFAQREEQEGKKGMGDVLEATHVLNDLDIQFLNPETNEVLLTGKAGRLQFSFDTFMNYHLFCATILDTTMFEVVNETSDMVEARLVFTDEQKEKFVEDFGADSAMFIMLDPFVQRLDAVGKEKGFEFRAGKVQYSDFAINEQKRIGALTAGNETDIFFWKDNSLAYQNEYRIVSDESSDSPSTVEIGDISEFSTIMPIEQLFNAGYLVRIENKK